MCPLSIERNERIALFSSSRCVLSAHQRLEYRDSLITGQQSSALLNYHFQSGNVLQGLPFLDNTFDFVHQRLLVTGIPFARWGEVIRELLRVTKVGGWLEMVEAGSTFVNSGAATA